MKTVLDLSEIAKKAVNLISKETSNSAESLCIVALMQSALQAAVDNTPRGP